MHESSHFNSNSHWPFCNNLRVVAISRIYFLIEASGVASKLHIADVDYDKQLLQLINILAIPEAIFLN
jgi:hypothetical protein